METIHVRSRSNADGILHLDIPVNLKDAELDITVTIEQKLQEAESDLIEGNLVDWNDLKDEL